MSIKVYKTYKILRHLLISGVRYDVHHTYHQTNHRLLDLCDIELVRDI